ncbi:hypothetical protein FRC01_000089, partial [Tulasnella sp. 417]
MIVIMIGSALEHWDTETWHPVQEKISIVGSPAETIIGFSPGGNTMAVSLGTKYINVCDILAVSAAFDRRPEAEPILYDLAVSGDGSRVVGYESSPGGSEPGYLHVWYLHSEGEPKFGRARTLLGRLACSADGRLFTEIYNYGTVTAYITVWDGDKLEVVTTKCISSSVIGESARFSNNSSLLA